MLCAAQYAKTPYPASAATNAAGRQAAGTPDAAGGSTSEAQGGASAYFVDTLFRRDPANSAGAAAASTPMSTSDAAQSSTEATRILANAMTSGSLAPEDARYVGQLVAQRTGLPAAEAEKRVTDTFARMQASAK